MFSWKEYARIHTALARKELVDKVCDYLDPVGETSIEGKGVIEVHTKQYNSFGYEVKIEAFVDPAKKDDEYDITVNYEIKPTAAGIILTVLFWPIGLILFLQGSSAKQQMQREITQALEDLEEKFA
jgi:hypothetical protein